TTPPASTSVKRACDNCHRRKVKCLGEGTKPCKNCVTAGLTCTYNAIPQKKGPKGSRARVLSELRETQQRQSQAGGSSQGTEVPFDIRTTRLSGLLTSNLINLCVDYFFNNLYPSHPFLQRQRIQEIITSMDHSIEAYCMVTALCAWMMIQPDMVIPPNVALHGEAGSMNAQNLGPVLLEEVVLVRKGYNYVENPTLLSVLTSFFCFGCFFCLDKHNSAWFHLMEATTLAQLLGIHDEETYKSGSSLENSRKRRLFWILFVTERAYALQKHRPLSLYPAIALPSLDVDPIDRKSLSGFLHLVNLYKPFDHRFIGLWNKVRTDCLPTWLISLQTQLRELLPEYLDVTEVQVVDLRTSQQWLRTMVWQLSISHGFISSVAADNAMNFKYPIEISRDLLAMSTQFSQQAMEVHGIGLVEKFFDIACTLVDVMAVVPFQQPTFELGPRDYLNRFLSLISSLRGGQQRYLPLLLSKVHDVLPNMQLPAYRGVTSPSNLTSNARMEELYEDPASGPSSHSPTP
ncbi:hypothetical protein M501DRAFT_908623, partial [Patellaria atrata CBS 101060]